MKNLVVGAGRTVRSDRKRAVRPVLEGLEERLLLYSYTGDHFTFGSRITWSIVPDGTNLGGVTSNFVSTMNQKLGTGNWIPAIQDAFAQWEKSANINVVQVSDNGAPTGSGNLQQGSPDFGDIRIGGYAQVQNILAYTLLPPPNNGGSDAGDIFFNTNEAWHINSDYDLETVAVHEIGHAAGGLGESAYPQAAEFAYYDGIKQGLAQDDVNGIQSVWGPRREDGIALGTSNFTSAQAADITKFTNGANNQIVLPNLDVATSAESYWFKFTTPANSNTNLTVQIQSQNLSELSPKVQLYDVNLQGLAQTSASATTYGATIDASIANATPNTTYYVRVLGSNIGATGSGAYAMTVNMGSLGIGQVAPPNTTVATQPDQGGGGIYELTKKLWRLRNEIENGLDQNQIQSLENLGLSLMLASAISSPGVDTHAESAAGLPHPIFIPSLPTPVVSSPDPSSTASDDDPDDSGGNSFASIWNPPAVGTPSILIGLPVPSGLTGFPHANF